MIDLEGLEKLRAEGTQGPWRTVGDKSPNMTGVHAGPHTSGDSYLLFTLINDPNDDGPMGEGGLLPETVAQWKADAALIVAAVNALPELIAMARRVEGLEAVTAERDRAQRACEQMGERITSLENDMREIGAAIINGATDTLWMGDQISDETIVDFICNRTGDDPSLLGTFARTALKEKPQ